MPNAPLSNRLYELDTINRREREASDQNFKLVIAGMCALGMLCIVVALFSGAP